MRKKHNIEVANQFKEIIGVTFDVFSKTTSIKLLLRLGEKVCGCDYAIQFFDNKKHPLFYRKEEKVRSAVRHAWALGAFEHRDRILESVVDWSEGGDKEE